MYANELQYAALLLGALDPLLKLDLTAAAALVMAAMALLIWATIAGAAALLLGALDPCPRTAARAQAHHDGEFDGFFSEHVD